MASPHRLSSFLAALLVSAAHARAEEPCLRLLDLLPTTSYAKGTHTVNLTRPASSQARWFLTASGEGPASIEVDGNTVVRPLDLAGPRRDRATVEVALQATSTLRIKVLGHTPLSVRVFGLVPKSDLPPGAGRPAGPFTAFEGTFPGGLPPRHSRVQVPVPSDGVFMLSARQAGSGPVLLARLLWNEEAALGVVALHDRIFLSSKLVVAPIRRAPAREDGRRHRGEGPPRSWWLANAAGHGCR